MRKNPCSFVVLSLTIFTICSLIAPSVTGASTSCPAPATELFQQVSPVPVEIVFVDAAVKEPALLESGLTPGARVVRLDPARDGMLQICETTARAGQVSAIHVISHAAPGRLFLGNATVSIDNLDRYAKQLKLASRSLARGGAILLYGCNLARGEAGERFVARIGGMTGAVVAASTDETGNAELGGNWNLEKRTGSLEGNVLSAPAYRHLLATTTFNADVTDTQSYTRPWTPGDKTFADADWEATWFTSDIITANTPADSSGSYNYITVTLLPSVTGSYTLSVDSGTGLLTDGTTDTQIWLYQNSFNPLQPLTNVLAVNEDILTCLQAACTRNWLSRISNVTLTQGTTYVLVVTTYTAGVTGTVSFSVTGPGSVALSGSTVTSGASPTYTVTYQGNGNTGGAVPANSTGNLENSTVTVASNSGNLVRTGYTFAGWNSAADGSGTSYTAGSGTFSITGDTTLYAKWTGGVTYNGNGNTGGSVPTDATAYLPGATVTAAGNSGSLTRTGYTFAGWNTAADGSGTSYAAGTGTFAMSGNTTLYAKWTGAVIYSGNGSTGGSTPTDAAAYLPGATVTAAGNTGSLTRTGYVFAGWNTAADGSGTSYAAGSGTFAMSGNTTLYAKWTGSITYNGNGSTGGSAPTDATTYLPGATVTAAGNTGSLTRTGYTFAGWNTAPDGSGTSYAAGTGTFAMSGSTTLYAKWTGSVTYNGNGNTGGSVPADATAYLPGATVTAAGNTGTLTRTGYTFAGWNSAADGSGTSYAAGTGTFAMAGNTALYAKWATFSADNNLSALSLSSGTLAPGFSSGTVSYTASVANSVASLTATPTVADSSATVTVNNIPVASGNASGAISLNVGSNTIEVIVTAQSGDTKTYTATVTRTAATQTITYAATASKTYGNADFGPGATIDTGLPLTYTSNNHSVATITAGGLVHIVGAGTAVITASQAGDSENLPATAQQSLTVAKASLTVTAENKSREYDTANPDFSALYSGFVLGEDSLVITGSPTFTTDAVQSSPAGSYTITPVLSGLSAANYTFIAANGTLAVGVASQSISFAPLSPKVYGDPGFTLSATGGLSGNPVTFGSGNPTVAAVSGNTVTIVGAGTAIITASQAGNGNYASATAQQTLTVQKAQATVTADNKQRSYGAANPAFSASLSGFVSGDDASAVTGSTAFTTNATQSSPPGSYAIIPDISGLSAANYTFAAANGTLAIEVAPQSIVIDAIAAKTYGSAPFALSAVGGASGNPVAFASSNSAVATIQGDTVTIVGAGTTTITASQAGSSNYASATAQQTLNVGKATLAVTARDSSRVYKTAAPVFSASYAGFVNGESSGVLQGAPELSTEANIDSPVGNYPITAGAGNLFSNNYSFSYASGTLTITPGTPVITWSAPAGILYGAPLGSGQLNAAADVPGSFAYTPAAGTILNVGVHPLNAVFTPADSVNYTGGAAGVTLAVGKATATVSLAGLTQSYDGAPGEVTATTTPTGLPVTITYDGSSVAPTGTGSYAVVATINDANYQGSASGTLTIAKGAQAISFPTLQGVELGDADFDPGATASSGLPVAYASSDPTVATVVNGKIHPVGVGTSTVTASQSGSANFASASASRTLTVRYGTTPPSLFVSAISDGAVTTETTHNISGRVSDVSGIKSLTVNGTDVQVNPDGSFSFPVQLISGANTITVVATNSAGISGTDTRTVTLDATAPKLSVTYPPDNAVAIQQMITVTGNIQSLISGGVSKSAAKRAAAIVDPTLVVTYSVNGSAPQIASLTDTVYSFSTYLDSGMNTIKVFAANAAGQKVEAKRTLSFQPGFSLAVTTPAADIRTALGSYTLAGSVTENTTPVSITITTGTETFTPPVVDGLFQQQLQFTEDKVYQVSVTGVDENSNSLTVQRNIIHTLPKANTDDGSGGEAYAFTIIDALLSLQFSAGTLSPQTDQVLRLDVAPMVSGVSVGDGKVDIEDVVVILMMAAGLIK